MLQEFPCDFIKYFYWDSFKDFSRNLCRYSALLESYRVLSQFVFEFLQQCPCFRVFWFPLAISLKTSEVIPFLNFFRIPFFWNFFLNLSSNSLDIFNSFDFKEFIQQYFMECLRQYFWKLHWQNLRLIVWKFILHLSSLFFIWKLIWSFFRQFAFCSFIENLFGSFFDDISHNPLSNYHFSTTGNSFSNGFVSTSENVLFIYDLRFRRQCYWEFL